MSARLASELPDPRLPHPEADGIPSTAAPELPRGVTSVRATSTGISTTRAPAEWKLTSLAGRFVELSGDRAGAALTSICSLVLEAQQSGEPCAWITRGQSLFFPPDAANTGIDLAALPIVRVQQTLQAARAADRLIRSGAFGLIALDLGPHASLPIPVQTRLNGLVRKHHVALICLTEKESAQPSLGSLVSLRAQTSRTERVEDRYRCEVQVIKDKRRGPGWSHREVYRGPDGLC